MSNPRLMNGMGSPQSVYVSSTTQSHAIGTRGVLPDGRVFYYTRNGTTTALTKNELLVAADPVANHVNQTVAATTDVTSGASSVVANIGATDAGVGVYTEGYFVMTDGTTQGDVYQIREFPGGTASTDITVEIYHNVVTTAGASDTFSLIENLYSNPQQSDTDQANPVCGVPLVTIAAATAAATATAAADTPSYGWVQTWGPCPVIAETSTTGAARGAAVTQSPDTAGTVSGLAVGSAEVDAVIGVMIDTAVDAETQLVDLRIRP